MSPKWPRVWPHLGIVFLLQLPILNVHTALGQSTASVSGPIVGFTETVPVPLVTEPWDGTPTPPAEVKPRRISRLGYFRGFQEAKRQANEARAKRLQGARTLAGPAAILAAPAAGIVFDGPSESDTNFIPPDPVIAAGPNHLVVCINSLIAIYSKAAVQQGTFQQFSSFFASLGVAGDIYDPRVIYDQTNNRFIISAAEVDLANFTNGHVLLAVSQTSDPTGAWYKYAVDFKGRNLSNTADTFPDFPTIGLSPSAVYLSTGQFTLNAPCLESNYCSFSDTWVKVIGLPELLSGNPALSIATFKDVRVASGEPAFTIQPALTYRSPTQEFLVAASFASNPGKKLTIFAVNISGVPTLSAADLPVGDFLFPPDASQPGSSVGIATNDFRLLNAVWSNGTLWCAHNVGDPNDNTVAARWYEIGASSLDSVTLLQSGTVKASGNAYYPAVSVKPNDDVAMAFTTSSFAQYPSAAFTGRATTDPSGSMRTPVVYRPGTSAYNDFGFRWGDYSGVSLDPDGSSIWMIAEYGGSPNPHFRTAIAQAGAPPSLNASVARLDFGNQPVTITSPAQSVTINNVSGGSLTLGNATLTGTNPGDFAITGDTCSGGTIPPGGSCTIGVTFTPPTTGSRSGTLVINSNPPGFPLQVLLTGNGIPLPAALVVSPTSLSFPNTVVRTSSPPRTVLISNYGSVPFSVSIYNPAYDYAVVNNCRAPVPPGGTCTLEVTFRPPKAGVGLSGWIDIFAQGTNQGARVDVSGNAITAPTATQCPTNVSFGNQAVGSTSNPQTVTLSNTGSENLTVSQITISGDFAQTNTCGSSGSSLPIAAACSISVTFAPTTTGTRSGTLTINDNAAGSPHTVALTGDGVALPAAPVARPAARASLSSDSANSPAIAKMTSPSADRSEHARKAYGELPLTFEANQGQTDAQVKFLSRGSGYTLFLTSDEAMVALKKPSVVSRQGSALRNSRFATPSSTQRKDLRTWPADFKLQSMDNLQSSFANSPALSPREPAPAVMRMKLVGANSAAKVVGAGELPGRSNYFIGNDPLKWRTNVPNYARVKYEGIYPGVDLVYYGKQRQLEYDFVVAPGADPQVIRFAVTPGRSPKGSARPGGTGNKSPVSIDANGDLHIAVDGGEMRFHKPVVYQERTAAGIGHSAAVADIRPGTTPGRQVVEGRFVLRASNQKPKIRNRKPFSPQFPTPHAPYEVAFELAAYDKTLPLVIDPILTYSTYLGGNSADYAFGIASNAAGEAYIVGATSSDDFPTANALQPAINRTLNYLGDAFITKLSADGSSFVYSTFLGGSNLDAARAIALDSAGNAYVTGETLSADFPVSPGAFQSSFQTGNDPYPSRAFVTKLSATGSALIYSTLLGGSAEDQSTGIAVDSSGNVYVTGTTTSSDFPVTPGAAQSLLPTYNGNVCSGSYCGSGFVAALNAQGSALLYATYLGGTEYNSPQGIALDAAGNTYITGITHALDFPTTPGAFQTGRAWSEPHERGF